MNENQIKEGFFSHLLGVNTSNSTAGKIANVVGRAAIGTIAVYGGIKLFSGDNTEGDGATAGAYAGR
jgi:hypothetical protein